MTDVVIASHEADARAADAMEQHHAELSGTLVTLVEGLVAAASRGDVDLAEGARQRLATWCQRELVPHALAEEQTLYPAAWATLDGRLLVEAMVAEHQVITSLVRSLSDDPAADGSAGAAVRAAANGVALRAVFESHLGKENDLIIPLLLRTPGASMADLLGGMHAILGVHQHDTSDLDTPDTDQTDDRHAGVAVDVAAQGCGSGHGCSCGETDSSGYPELDARSISLPWRPSSQAAGWCWLPRTTR
jgi:hemerythrin-like domain-containing protein